MLSGGLHLGSAIPMLQLYRETRQNFLKMMTWIDSFQSTTETWLKPSILDSAIKLALRTERMWAIMQSMSVRVKKQTPPTTTVPRPWYDC